MKLQSERVYKHDLSDIVGIIKENNEKGHDLSIRKIEVAYLELYNEPLKEKDIALLDQIFSSSDYEELYYATVDDETRNKQFLLEAQENYGNVLNQNNIAQFLKGIHKKHQKLKQDECERDTIHLTDTIISFDAPDDNHPESYENEEDEPDLK